MQATISSRAVNIGEIGLKGLLSVPSEASGLVIFAHGSGSGRHSPRNNYVAKGLNDAGLATLLLDLLTPDEERDRTNVFDIPLLADRLSLAAGWAGDEAETAWLRIGYFGASTGAGAALMAAADANGRIGAIVSRGGRPDLAGRALARVTAPTLLIVGSLDAHVLELNRQAISEMRCERQLAIVPGAGHLFEEPGTLDDVVLLARGWFVSHLREAHDGKR